MSSNDNTTTTRLWCVVEIEIFATRPNVWALRVGQIERELWASALEDAKDEALQLLTTGPDDRG